MQNLWIWNPSRGGLYELFFLRVNVHTIFLWIPNFSCHTDWDVRSSVSIQFVSKTRKKKEKKFILFSVFLASAADLSHVLSSERSHFYLISHFECTVTSYFWSVGDSHWPLIQILIIWLGVTLTIGMGVMKLTEDLFGGLCVEKGVVFSKLVNEVLLLNSFELLAR